MSDVYAGLTAALADRYRIEREVGEGGMATVYLAEDLRHHRKVALKVLRPELAATLGVDRFLREIEVAANLQHPHILPLFDSGEAGGFLFYVMPYIEGESLRGKLQRGELPVAEAARILRDVVDALAHAHQQGVVHRDVKPDNVLLSGRHALVTDFGVAKAVSEATGRQALTTVGVALGTPTYMAPEQATADPHVDFRADLYAVGVMAYEMLAGRPPFTGVSPQAILAAHVTEAPTPLTEVRQSVPAALGDLVMKCLEKRPADRPTSAEVLLPQLEALATPSGGITPMSTVPLRAVESVAPRRGTRTWAIAGVAVVVAVGLGYGVLRMVRGSEGGGAPAQSIAVLPFENTGGDRANQVFTDGVQDEILTDLTSVGALQVTSRTSVLGYRDSKKSVQQIGRELGVRTLLEGQVQRAGDQVRVNVQLVDAPHDRQIWASSYNRALTAENVFAIQGEIAQSVAQALAASFTASQATAVKKAPTTNLAALDWYHRGKELWDGRGGLNDTAITAAFQRATALDSTFAEAWAWLGAARSWEVRDGLTTDTMPPRTAIDRARALAPSLPDVALAEAYFAYYAKGAYGDALRHFQAVVAARPGDVGGLQGVANIARRQGRWQDALDTERRVITLDPRDAEKITDHGETYMLLRQFDSADAEFRRALILDPVQVLAQSSLVMTLSTGRGDTAAARAAVSPTAGRERGYAPFNPGWLLDRWAGHYAAADSALASGAVEDALDPAYAFIGCALNDLASGNGARARARADSALPIARAYVAAAGDRDVFGNVARGYAALGLAEAILGKGAQAVADGEKGVALNPTGRDAVEGPRSTGALILIHLVLGHREEAVRLLQRQAGLSYGDSPSLLPITRAVIRMDPLFAQIRNDPRVQKLLADDAAWVVK